MPGPLAAARPTAEVAEHDNLRLDPQTINKMKSWKTYLLLIGLLLGSPSKWVAIRRLSLLRCSERVAGSGSAEWIGHATTAGGSVGVRIWHTSCVAHDGLVHLCVIILMHSILY